MQRPGASCSWSGLVLGGGVVAATPAVTLRPGQHRRRRWAHRPTAPSTRTTRTAAQRIRPHRVLHPQPQDHPWGRGHGPGSTAVPHRGRGDLLSLSTETSMSSAGCGLTSRRHAHQHKSGHHISGRNRHCTVQRHTEALHQAMHSYGSRTFPGTCQRSRSDQARPALPRPGRLPRRFRRAAGPL